MIATQENQEIHINSNAVLTSNSFISCLANNNSIAFLGDTDYESNIDPENFHLSWQERGTMVDFDYLKDVDAAVENRINHLEMLLLEPTATTSPHQYLLILGNRKMAEIKQSLAFILRMLGVTDVNNSQIVKNNFQSTPNSSDLLDEMVFKFYLETMNVHTSLDCYFKISYQHDHLYASLDFQHTGYDTYSKSILVPSLDFDELVKAVLS